MFPDILARSEENLWIGLIRQGRTDPHDLVVRNSEVLVTSIENALLNSGAVCAPFRHPHFVPNIIRRIMRYVRLHLVL